MECLPLYNIYITIFLLRIAEIIFTLVFLTFLKNRRFFVNCGSLTYIILSFFLQLYKITELQLFVKQCYKITELQPLWISDQVLSNSKNWKNNKNKIDEWTNKKASYIRIRYIYWVCHWLGIGRFTALGPQS